MSFFPFLFCVHREPNITLTNMSFYFFFSENFFTAIPSISNNHIDAFSLVCFGGVVDGGVVIDKKVKT